MLYFPIVNSAIHIATTLTANWWLTAKRIVRILPSVWTEAAIAAQCLAVVVKTYRFGQRLHLIILLRSQFILLILVTDDTIGLFAA